MGGHQDSSSGRLPRELWWMILDMVISSPQSLATIYDGDDWANQANAAFRFHEFDEYKQAESRRTTVGMVCKSWQSFATSRRDRLLVLRQDYKAGKMSASINTIMKARRIIIKALDKALIQGISRDVNWEILEAPKALAERLADKPPPRLQRLILSGVYGQSDDLNSERLLSLLDSFHRITWLEYHVRGPDSLVSVKGVDAPIGMPNVQVLIHHSTHLILFPFGSVQLPSLQYLSICSKIRRQPNTTSLINIITKYQKTLRSVIFLAECPVDDSKQFPLWSDFPHLGELMIESTFNFRFAPLPLSHPLRRIIVRQWSIDTISSWINSVNMRHIMLLDAMWNWDGKLCGISSNVFISRAKIVELMKMAKGRGIRLEVSWSGDEIYHTSIARNKPNSSGYLGYFKNTRFAIRPNEVHVI
ncbi:hypothetical protein CPB86DRAFT_877434 [Serendipita vermifera]|nr:hypothetical protein CPB86DRAFT_877434 [Serendipita vermifera]